MLKALLEALVILNTFGYVLDSRRGKLVGKAAIFNASADVYDYDRFAHPGGVFDIYFLIISFK